MLIVFVVTKQEYELHLKFGLAQLPSSKIHNFSSQKHNKMGYLVVRDELCCSSKTHWVRRGTGGDPTYSHKIIIVK